MSTRSYRTPKGTTLPIMLIKGKEYLEVKYRIVWFREEQPEASIETEIMNMTDNQACVRATIKDQSGRVLVTSHKIEDRSHFSDFAEKAETGSIGRALALLGYGTQFTADELDEGNRIVDGPINQKQSPQPKKESAPKQKTTQGQVKSEDLGDYKIPVGVRLKGKALKNVQPVELEAFINWIEERGPAGNDEEEFLKKAKEYIKSKEKQ